MSKNLIYFPENEIAPHGGPAGYLYNLRVGLQSIGQAGVVDFLPPSNGSIEKNAWLRDAVPGRIKDVRRLRNMLSYVNRHVEVDSSLSRYDLIHFHKSEDLYFARDFLESYDGTVVLTTHCPCAPYQELIGRLNPKDAQRRARQLQQLETIDEYSFKRADYVVFPCREAEEPYFNTWPEYPMVRDSEKLRYLPTGIVPPTARRTRRDVRHQYGIPDDAFVVCYVGRHNQIKGYPDLLEAGKCVLSNTADTSTCFLVAGREEPLHGLDDSRWIEVGWTNDPHSLMVASDVFVLPNRQTYFDLVLLEVLSLGVPVIASRTGGNKYFQQFQDAGIRYYDDLPGLVAAIGELRQMPRQQLTSLGQRNRELFYQHFCVEEFARGYVRLLDELSRK